jgi:hypothetical protein
MATMPDLKLNLKHLRTLGLQNADAPAAPFEMLPMTRRAVLSLFGASTAGAALIARQSAVTWENSRNHLTFFLDGRPAWQIRTDAFDGFPQLEVTGSDDDLRFSLQGARFPGMDLTADFEARVWRTDRWQMDLRRELFGQSAKVDFVEWLRQAAPAESIVDTAGVRIGVGPGEAVEITGRARAFFRPDWRTEVQGLKIARLHGFGHEHYSDRITLALVDDADPSLIAATFLRRAAIQIYRGAAAWHFNPGMPPSKRGELIVPPNAFDVVIVEAGTTVADERVSAAVAKSLRDDGRLRFRPTEKLSLSGRKPFSFPLQHAVYARTMHGGVRREAILGLLPESDVWVHGEGFSAQLTTAADDRNVQLTALGGCLQQCRILARVKGIAAALDEAVIAPGQLSPLEKDKGKSLPLVHHLQQKKSEIPADGSELASDHSFLGSPGSRIRIHQSPARWRKKENCESDCQRPRQGVPDEGVVSAPAHCGTGFP